MPKIEIPIGARYGHLRVNKFVKNTKGQRLASVVCDCGRSRMVYPANLRSGRSQSCGRCVPRTRTSKPKQINEVATATGKSYAVARRLIREGWQPPASESLCRLCAGKMEGQR
jgi:hypothetical protein